MLRKRKKYTGLERAQQALGVDMGWVKVIRICIIAEAVAVKKKRWVRRKVL